MLRLPLTIVAVVLYATAGLGQQPSTPDRHKAESELKTLDEEWSATAARNDLNGTVAFYADNAVLLPPNAPIATNKKSIRESWAGLLGPHTSVSWKWSKVEVAQSGELGYIYGTYKLAIAASIQSVAVNDTGKFLEVWKKQPNGKWKCIVDTYNSDLPDPAPAK
jgi:ketosteroid isomerase-like protein